MAEGALRSGWTRVAFGDMVDHLAERVEPTPEDGEKYIGLEHLESGSLTVHRWGADVTLVGTKLRVRKGDILFARRNAYLRRVAIAPHDGLFSAHGMVLRARPRVVVPEFLPFFMQSDVFMDRAVKISVGSLSPTINWKTLEKEEFDLPPLHEQRRMVRLLKAAEWAHASASRLYVSTQGLLASLQKHYFIDRPEGMIKEIGEVATVRNGTTPSRSRKEYWGGEVPWLPSGKVNERRIRAAEQYISDKALRECSVSLIPRGATLVAMVGEGHTRGRAALLEMNACINQNLAAVIPGDSIDPLFMFLLLESQYEALRHWSHGTNQHALNCRLISSFRIRVPSLERQQRVSSLLGEIDSDSEYAARRASDARRMFGAVLDGALGRG